MPTKRKMVHVGPLREAQDVKESVESQVKALQQRLDRRERWAEHIKPLEQLTKRDDDEIWLGDAMAGGPGMIGGGHPQIGPAT